MIPDDPKDSSIITGIRVTEPNDVETDYEYSRKKYKELIEQAIAINERALQLATESEAPRAFEVASAMLTNASALVDKLMELQAKKKKIETIEKPQDFSKAPPALTQTNVFVGSPAELQRMLKDREKLKAASDDIQV
jgi:hypothetical protein